MKSMRKCRSNPALRPTPVMVEARSVVRLEIGRGRPSCTRFRKRFILTRLASGAGWLAEPLWPAWPALWADRAAQHLVSDQSAGRRRDSGLGQCVTLEQLRAFNGLAFGAALVGHGIISCLVGVVYAVMLPMFPKYAPFWAGILMPLFWSGLVATTLNILNPGHERSHQLALVCGVPAWIRLGGRICYCAKHQYQDDAVLVASGTRLSPCAGHEPAA